MFVRISRSLQERLIEARHLAAILFTLVLFCLALWVLRRELHGVHIADVLDRVGSLSPSSLALALLTTSLSYLALTGYDALALRYLGHPLPFWRIAMTSFIATAVGHNLGVAMLSGGAVRLRMYTAMGLSAAEVAAVVGMIGLTFGIGMAFAVALVCVFVPGEAAQLLHITESLARGAGVLVLAALGAYMVWGAARREPLGLGGWRIRIPGVGVSLAQIALAAADLAMAAATLYVLLPDPGASFPAFLGVYVLSIGAGILSHVPAGLGVFETVLLLGLPDAPREGLLAAVLVYRLIYYLLPLAVAALLAALHELQLYHRHVARGIALAQDALEGVAPQILAVTVFVSGALLLFSGATPAMSGRLEILSDLVPLAFLELSHLAGSLVGLGLVVLAGSLYRRVNAAYHLALWLLVTGAVASLVKGLDWEEALVSGLVAVALWASRDAFYRPASLWHERLTPAWLAVVTLALAGSLWLGLFAFRHVQYANELWWEFAFDSAAPRFLRTALLLVVAVTALALARLLQTPPATPERPTQQDLERAADLVARSPHAESALALLGDKRLLFDEGGKGFLMFQTRGRSWIAMGDPIGTPEAVETLAWRFRELCDQHGGRPVFYQVDVENLHLYLDLGLSPLKIGEEAVVPLAGFNLEGRARAELRQVQRKIMRTGAEFSVVPPESLSDALMAELKDVSDAWMTSKHTREKGFALGRFSPDYLSHFPIALVRSQGRVLAFANLWTGADRAELSVDLMRHVPDAPNGVMDYLFVEMMLWGAAQGFRELNLGMAPLSGLESHPLAPLWHRIGTLVFRHGENFYNFEGLRAYKSKFRPKWRPKYLVVPRGTALPTVLLDVAALIGGGIKGVFAR